MPTRAEIEALAKKVRDAADWNEACQHLDEIMTIADLQQEWKEATGDTFEEVIREAGVRLNVNLCV